MRIIYFLFLSFSLCLFSSTLYSQVTPIGGACTGSDCLDQFNWTSFDDGMGNIIGAEGIAQSGSCGTTIDASVEYEGPDATPTYGSTVVGSNMQGDPPGNPDKWTFSFGTPLTNPIIDFNGVKSAAEVCITDCNGMPLTVTALSGTLVAGSGPGCYTSVQGARVQIDGATPVTCIIVTLQNNNNANDAYTFGIETCLDANPPPPCTACPANFHQEFITLKNYDNMTMMGDVELDGLKIGTSQLISSTITNPDFVGPNFGGYDQDGGTLLFRLDFCEPFTMNEIQMKGLETDSEASIGTSESGGVLSGINLTACGSTGPTMMPMGGLVENTSTSCSNQGNGQYLPNVTTVSTLFFKYFNPPGNCVVDKMTFKIAACVPDAAAAMAIPECPLTLVTLTTNEADVIANGVITSGSGKNSDIYIRDKNGKWFNKDMCSDFNPVPVVAQPTISISPCAVVVSEEECEQCTPTPPCVTCTAGDSKFLFLDRTGGLPNAPNKDLDFGLVKLGGPNGVCLGTYEFLFSDLDIRNDGQGTTFGGFDNDGGTMLLQVDFCDPLFVNQIDIRNLEAQSIVSVGTTLDAVSKTGNVGGTPITICDNPSGLFSMMGSNSVFTDAGTSCSPNPNGAVRMGAAVSTLYFKYDNPATSTPNCRFDYVGFKIRVCHEAPATSAIPVCPIQPYEVACQDPSGAYTNIKTYLIDNNGNVFDGTTCAANIPRADGMGNMDLEMAVQMGVALKTVDIGCAEIREPKADECDFDSCVETPTCMATMCPPDTDFKYIRLVKTSGAAPLPSGDVELNKVKVGTYEFLFGDLDNSLDGVGSTFGGWDTDGGTLLLKLEFCTPLTITELDIRNLEVGSEVSVGTASSTMDASAVLSGQTLTFCGGSNRMTLNDGAPNLVKTDGPGCAANPNATYTVGTNPVTTLFFKYHNPPSDGTHPSKCRGDYVGFRIAACAPRPMTVLPECPLNLYTVGSQMLVRDKNGRYFNYSMACPASFPTVAKKETIISACETPVLKMQCDVCVIPGLAKAVTNVATASSGVQGNVDVTFKFTLTNTGPAEMINLQINDDLASLPGYVGIINGPTITMDQGSVPAVVNPAYAGMGNLLNGTSGSLNDGEDLCVEIVIEFDPTNTPNGTVNTATGGGTPPTGSPVLLDNSNNGLNPDPNGMVPTPLNLPRIDLAKEITNLMLAGAPGKFLAEITLNVMNTGNVVLNNVVIVDDIASQLGASFVGMNTPPVEDPNFDGRTDTDIPIGTLAIGQMRTVVFTIEIMSPVPGSNQANASGQGLGPNGMTITVTDPSDAGLDPQSTNPNSPSVNGTGVPNTATNPTLFGPGATRLANGLTGSLSCPDQMNVVLGRNCTAKLLTNFAGNGPAGGLYAVEIFVEGVYVGNMLNRSHVGKKIIYKFTDLSTGASCWGNINLEDKNLPEHKTSTQTVMCSAPLPGLEKLADVIKRLDTECGTPVTDVVESFVTEGNTCGGLRSIRKITGVATIDGNKMIVPLRTDTIIETPLDTSMVTCPIGGPTQRDALKLNCEELDFQYPTPEVVEYYYTEYFKSKGYKAAAAKAKAIQRAYPHVEKGIVPDSVIDRINRTITSTTVPTKVLLNGVWVILDIVQKDTTYDTIWKRTDYPGLIPLPKGVTCNISVKCTDWHFPGCTGDSAKIMRNWQLLDWCNGRIKECTQWILVEPKDPHFTKVLGKKVTKNSDGSIDFYKMWPNKIVPVGIAPWTCAAELQLSAMVDWSCISDGYVGWTTSAGTIGNDLVLRGLWLGEEAEVTATLLGCHSLAVPVTFTFTVRPINNIYPVPIAEDQVYVTITGDPTGTVSPDGGVAKVFVDAIDAGSHNAGCGDVEGCLLLKEELENPVIIGGVHVSVGGHLIYHAAQCVPDGILKGKPETKLTPAIPDIPYVYCKDYVKFCCADVGENQVALVVTNEGGRTAYSWSTVVVEDKSSASAFCVDGVIDCSDEFDVNDYKPVIQSTVCADYELIPEVTYDLDACGAGYYTIVWSNASGDEICVSDITVLGINNFNPYEIKWPKHYTGEEVNGLIRECELWLNANGDPVLDSKGNAQYRIVEYSGKVAMGATFECVEGGNTGAPVWCEVECSLIGSTFEPLEVDASEACTKVIRRWTVIDWCVWDPNSANPDDDNDTEYDQFQAIDDEWLDDYDPAQAGKWFTDYRQAYENGPVNYPDGIGVVTKLACESCDKTNGIADAVYFRYKRVDPDGYYTFDQVIKVIDNYPPTIDAEDLVIISVSEGATAKGDPTDECFTDEDIPAAVTDLCGEIDIATDGASWWVEVYESDADGAKGDLITATSKFGSSIAMNSQTGYPGDYHLIVWLVKDGCGNEGTASTLVYFKDQTQPTPICIQDLSTAIMPSNGRVEIWASDYDLGSFDNCSEVEFYFLVDSLGVPTDDQENGTYTPNLEVTCDILSALGGSETIVLGLYVSDAEGNIDFCNISLNVNGAQDICNFNSGAALISGLVITPFGDRVEQTEISLNVGAKDLTDVDGTYAFNGNEMYLSYDLKAQKDVDYANGISTLDLVLIQRHILGEEIIDNPYNLIAADVNNDGRITGIDLVDLRRLILGITDDFPSNESWRFVDAKEQFDDPSSPFPFTEILNISSLDKNMMDENFIGVKIGDVNGTARANSLVLADSRASRGIELYMENVSVGPGEIIEVPVILKSSEALVALQLTLELQSVDFVGLRPGGMNVAPDQFALLDQNTLTMAWSAIDAAHSVSRLYTLILEGREKALLSESISLSSRVTEARAYTSDGERLDINMSFESIGAGEFALWQNQPNPFRDVTNIGFDLPEAGQATLRIFDVTGVEIYEINGDYPAGYNEVILRKSDLSGSGVLYYELMSGNHTSTKRMILIE